MKMDTHFLECMRDMPRLKHWPDRCKDFDICNSEVARWIVEQPEILQKLFTVSVNKGVIVFDRETGTWRGSNVE